MAPKEEKVKKNASNVKKMAPPVTEAEIEEHMPPTKVFKKRKSSRGNFSSYIHRVLRQVHPEMGISVKCMSIMESFINDMFNRIINESAMLVNYAKVKTMSSRTIQSAVHLVLPGELAKHAVSEGSKAMTLYFQNRD